MDIVDIWFLVCRDLTVLSPRIWFSGPVEKYFPIGLKKRDFEWGLTVVGVYTAFRIFFNGPHTVSTFGVMGCWKPDKYTLKEE